jgi:superfamily I DNA and/or RNA helicase
LGDEGSEGIEVDSVDAFQGCENEYILLSCACSSEKGNMGFLTSKNRLNVFISHAKCGLIIIGNVQTLTNNPLWRSLIVHCSSQGVLVQGPLNALEKCIVPKPLESSY